MPKQLTSEEADRLKHLTRLRETYQRNVDHYEQAAGKYGGEDSLPLHMMHDLRSNREKLLEVAADIAKLKKEDYVENMPKSEPMLTQMTLSSKVRIITPTQRVELAKLLLNCQSIKSSVSRGIIINMLENISYSIMRDSNPLIDVLNIISICLDHENGVETLLNIVRSFEGKALPMQKVDAYWQSL